MTTAASARLPKTARCRGLAQCGVTVVPYLEGRSTTRLIEEVHRGPDEGAQLRLEPVGRGNDLRPDGAVDARGLASIEGDEEVVGLLADVGVVEHDRVDRVEVVAAVGF